MKILILQLARLGDIYQTWPVLRALKRTHVDAEIHLLTRSKFAVAASGLDVLAQHWTLDTKEVLAPLVDEKPGIDDSLEKLNEFASMLNAEQFDLVVNLTFSPFSSYLTREIAGVTAQIRGYTRFSDGYLCIPDDGSAYFYAQTGPGKPNRVHVTDLFAHVAGVELTEQDWQGPQLNPEILARASISEACKNAVLVHVGASDLRKTLSWNKWMQVVRSLLQSHDGPVVLIGSKEEEEFAAKIAAVSGDKQPINLVGKTNLEELTAVIASARLLIGGDSGPVQIASLTQTPVLNISFPMVNLWETGPRAKGSRIVAIQEEGDISSDEVAAEAMAMLQGKGQVLPVIRVPGPTFPYVETRPQAMSFEWEILRALYMGEAFPTPQNELFLVGLQRLNEVNSLALEQIEVLNRQPSNQTAAAILDRADEVMDQIIKMVPATAPIVSWFRTERQRLGPMPVERLIAETSAVHAKLGEILELYVGPMSGLGGEDDDINVG